MSGIFVKLFGTYNARNIYKYQKVVKKINALEDEVSKLSDEELQHKTIEFKDRLVEGQTLNDILPEAFAVVRETSKRVLGMRHFDVQLIGGMVLHDGCIAEMKTGEGKTLVATLAIYLNALEGKGAHVVTVNDYLAKRDAEWMGKIYRFLGLSVGCLIDNMSEKHKKEAYDSDITYGTNHEFGFDYLRDNLKFSEGELVMRPFNFAVVDEVDSILIDEARTPLIISGMDSDSSALYVAVNEVMKHVTDGDYEKEEKTRNVTLTDNGVEKIETMLQNAGILKGSSLYDAQNITLVHHVNCALKAHIIFRKDVDYIVKNGEVIIIDEFTGRIMDGRRYSEGIHQAIEAKEGVKVQTESQTVATISYQNLFRMYPKLSGMTGTAMTEETEFFEIYKLKVVSIPSNVPVQRRDFDDSVFISVDEKYAAVAKLIKECISRQQPVLVGTTSIERSEYISALLKKEGVKHNILNARHHEQEAYIIAEAGTPGAVTIATNMAGRGTDIKLGGSVEMRAEIACQGIEDEDEIRKIIEAIKEDVNNKKSIAEQAGGLFVIGTERNESRRIDNQLRGRSGRQGDPGASKFFLSVEDDLLKRFSQNFGSMLQKRGFKKDEEITHRWISKIIEKAQQRVEAYNFEVRKQLLKFDDVMNDQRTIIYEQRHMLMKSNDVREDVLNMKDDVLEAVITYSIPPNSYPDDWNINGLISLLKQKFACDIDVSEMLKDETVTVDKIRTDIDSEIIKKYTEKEEKYTPSLMRYIEKDVFLKVLDKAWRDHLVTLEHLRRGINLRSYAQKNPLNEYKFEAFNLFQSMLESVKNDIISVLFHFEMNIPNYEKTEENPQEIEQLDTKGDTTEWGDKRERNNGNIKRNDLCFCGSGKKYKHCHGSLKLGAAETNSSSDTPEE